MVCHDVDGAQIDLVCAYDLNEWEAEVYGNWDPVSLAASRIDNEVALC